MNRFNTVKKLVITGLFTTLLSATALAGEQAINQTLNASVNDNIAQLRHEMAQDNQIQVLGEIETTLSIASKESQQSLVGDTEIVAWLADDIQVEWIEVE